MVSVQYHMWGKSNTEAFEYCHNLIYRDTNRTCFGMLLCTGLSGVESLLAQAEYEEENRFFGVFLCPPQFSWSSLLSTC